MTALSPTHRCLVLGVLTILVLGLCLGFPNAATDPQTGMELALPPEIAGHATLALEPDLKEKELLPRDTGILKRSYIPLEVLPPSGESLSRADFRKGIHATLILSGNDPRSLHKPEVCLDGQGWVITSKTVITLKVNGHPLEVMDFTMFRTEQDGEHPIKRYAHYVYWWIGKDRSTPHDWDRIIFSDLDNILKNVNNRWGYPSVMVYVDSDEQDGDEVAKRRVYDWIETYAPTFQKSLAQPPAPAS